MRKLTLEALAVETFVPDDRLPADGTVRAHESAFWEMCDLTTTTVDPRLNTCGCTAQTACGQASCVATCQPGCGASGGCATGQPYCEMQPPPDGP